jgi:two-component system, NtrC family, nitrogen regulation sensor histidine kinase NtrY
MKLRDRIRRHSRDNRLIVAVLLALFVVLAGVFYLVLRSRDLPGYLVTDRLLLFVLFYVNGILILTILFVLLRNVYKLLVERHNRILGSKFKFKLVASFVGLSLIPVLLLFFIATELFQGTMDRWFSTQVSEVREQGNAVAEALSDRVESTALRDAEQVRRAIAGLDLGDPAAKPELARRLGELLAQLDLDLLAVYDGREFVQATVDPSAGIADLPEAPRDLLAEAQRDGRAVRTLEPAGVPGPLVLAAVGPPPPDADAAAAPGEPPWAPPAAAREAPAEGGAVVAAGVLLDPRLAGQVRDLRQAYLAFRQVEVQRENLAASHLLTFLMVTLLILLASSWTGLYLARRVTVPIQALAAGTRRISLGDLDHQVVTEADDELGVLVDSFNRMTRELKRNKEVIERSNEELTAANRDLAEERSLIAAVLDNVAAGVISIDPEGRILTCNGAALAILHQRADDVLGRPAAEAWADPERARLAALVQRGGGAAGDGGERAPGAAGRRRLTREIHLRLGGEWKVLEVKVTPLEPRGDGGPAAPGGGPAAPGGGPAAPGGGRVLVLEDLTELIKAQQLAAWSEAARRIAHEIKNPLTPIKLSAERVLMRYRQGDPNLGEALEEGVEVISREVATLQGMVDEFSRYARMPRPHPTAVDVGRLVGDTLDLYRDLKAGVEVDSRVDARLGEVSLDAQQIRRALINLIDNAIEATEAPGRVTVGAHRADGHLEIDVADTGRGIPAEARDKLFLPYFSTKGRGTGLGLAIVHRIVTDHHGRIRVEDNRPHGTVFTMELPLR